MVNSKQLNNKLKSTPKMSLRTRQVSTHDQSTPCSSATNFNDEEFLEMIREIVKEEIKNHEEEVGEIIKGQLENTNNRLDRISQEVVDITKSLEFTQEQLDEELAKLKNDTGKIQTDMKYIEDDLLDPENETPIIFNNLIKKPIHKYPTKFSKNSFSLKTFFLNDSKYCISFRGPKVWNDFLTNEEKEINSYLLFSKTIKSKLIETEEELRYF